MKLRTRIVIITFFTILFVQGINGFLEIGFLFNNLEENYINKYKIIGNEIKRKLDKSLLFGKPLTHINYKRLLADIVPTDIENLYIIDNSGQKVYSSKKGDDKNPFQWYKSFTIVKSFKYYKIFIPLSTKTQMKGNIIIIVSNKEIKEKLFYLIKKSLINFLAIIVVTLPVLFILLTIFINKPYYLFINNLEKWITQKEYGKLKKNGVDLDPIFNAEKKIKEIKQGDWLSLKNKSIYEYLDFEAQGLDNKSHSKKMYDKFMKLLSTN